MFFNEIIGHDSVRQQLTHALRANALPRALLLGGPLAAGKCSIALEIARVLNCGDADAEEGRGAEGEEGGDARRDGWPGGEMCASCAEMARLTHPGVLLLGGRYLTAELGRVFETARAHPESATAELLLFSVRKATKRVDPEFVTISNAQHRRRTITGLERIEEAARAVERLLPLDQANTEELKKHYQEMYEELQAIIPLFPTHISVDTVRAVREWLSRPPVTIIGSARGGHGSANGGAGGGGGREG